MLLVKYLPADDGSGCCIIGAVGASAVNPIDNYHRSCVCPKATNISECQNLCSKDRKCKGFAQHFNSKSCILATNSLCSPGCHGPYNKNNLGALDNNPENCAQGDFEGGCHIKENCNGMFSQIRIKL